MKKNLIPNELYDQKSFFSLGGASTAVWLFTNVFGNLIGIDVENKFKWIGLIIALFISFLGAIQVKKLNLTLGTVAFFNGILIFVAASGINAINQSVTSEPPKIEQKEASLFGVIDKETWWKPAQMKNKIIDLKNSNDSLVLINKSFEQRLDSCSKNVTKPISRLDSIEILRNEIYGIKQSLEELKQQNKLLTSELDVQKTRKFKPKNDTSEANEKIIVINYLEELYLANRDLEKNLKEYMKAGKLNPTGQYQAYKLINENVFVLNSQLRDYNEKIQKLAVEVQKNAN